MSENKTFTEKLFASGKNALNPIKLLARVFMFIVFGVLTAFPYLINALNKANFSGTVWYEKLFSFVAVASEATGKGMLIGFSSLFDIVFNKLGDGTMGAGDWIYGTLVLFFGIWVVYQPLAILFDIADLKQGAAYSKLWALLSSLVILIFLIAGAYFITDGQTLTSSIDSGDDIIADAQENIYNETDINVSDIVAVIDFNENEIQNETQAST
jgi:hypothetical protein